MTEKDTSGQDSRQKARMLQDMLLDALHAMRSLEQVEGLEKPGTQERTPEGLIDRLASLTGSALRFGVKATDTSLRVGRALINSQDQLRAMLTAGQSLKDIREVAGLTLSEMSEALNLRDKSVLEAIENGTSTLSFELILRLAALIARNDPIPFIMRTTRNYNPEVWQILNDWGVARLPLQFEREREFINIFRRHDDARTLSDEGFQKVLEFTRQSFEMSLHFIEEQEQEVAKLQAAYEDRQPDGPASPRVPPPARSGRREAHLQPNSAFIPVIFGLCTTPFSVTMASIRLAGVTSKTGLNTLTPSGASGIPRISRTSIPSRSSIGTSAPDSRAISTVLDGATTMKPTL